MHALKEEIRRCAAVLGFELCHFTRPILAEHHRTGLDRWIDAGMYGEMGYMAEAERSERRRQPESMLPHVRSVISLAMRHAAPSYTLDQSLAARGRGAIAAYAHGDDYHETMKRSLKTLAVELDRLLGVHAQRVYVDTAPVLEHALAASAGLGWQGKHTLTIDRKFGSFFLLGEIFTTAEIEPDPPASSHCGRCTRCLDSCPTGAIVAPYVVDARHCISYLTIEYNGEIPRELRSNIGNRIFGCDDCQLVCPWNGELPLCDNDRLFPRPENSLPDLDELFALNEAEFKERFRRSPIRRSGFSGLRRNIAVAMGNSGEGRFIPVLLAALNDSTPLVRQHAVWGLGVLCSRSGNPYPDKGDIVCALRYHLASEQTAEVAEEIGLALRLIEESP